MARKIPRKNSRQPDSTTTSPRASICPPRHAASSIFSANHTSSTEPPSHSAQRTLSNCSSTVIPASAAMAYSKSPTQVPRPSQKPCRKPRCMARVIIAILAMPISRHRDRLRRKPLEKGIEGSTAAQEGGLEPAMSAQRMGSAAGSGRCR
ncbi:hypothetical protein D3C81_1610130 [compost metagenome]